MKEVRDKHCYEAPWLRLVPIAKVSADSFLSSGMGYGDDLTGGWGASSGDLAGYGDDLTGGWDDDGN